jgi:hypothetical protein
MKSICIEFPIKDTINDIKKLRKFSKTLPLAITIAGVKKFKNFPFFSFIRIIGFSSLLLFTPFSSSGEQLSQEG